MGNSLGIRTRHPRTNQPVYGITTLDAHYEWYADTDGRITLRRENERRRATKKEQRIIENLLRMLW